MNPSHIHVLSYAAFIRFTPLQFPRCIMKNEYHITLLIIAWLKNIQDILTSGKLYS